MINRGVPKPFKVFSDPASNRCNAGDKNWSYRMACKKGQDTFAEHEKNAVTMSQSPIVLAWLEVAEGMLLQCMKYNEFTLGACHNMKEIRKVIEKSGGGKLE